jgi:hypothetical protein
MNVPGRPVPQDLLRGVLEAATIGNLAASFAHDANNRLTVLMASLDLLGTTDSALADRESALRLAQGAANQLADEVRALLAASRVHRQARQRVVIAEAMARVVDALDAVADRWITIACDLPPGLATEAEPGRLELALLHALRVAHLCGATMVTVTAGAFELPDRDPARPWLRKGRHCEIRYRLQGGALSAPVLPVEPAPGLDPASSLHPAGLELAAVEEIVRSLRGAARATTLGPTASLLQLFVPHVA